MRALALLAVLAGCGSDPDPRPPTTVDERARTYRGVGIGSTRDEAEPVLGRAQGGKSDPLAPVGRDATELGIPPAPQDPGSNTARCAWLGGGTCGSGYDPVRSVTMSREPLR